MAGVSTTTTLFSSLGEVAVILEALDPEDTITEYLQAILKEDD